MDKTITAKQRLTVVVCALLPAGVNLLQAPVAAAGSLAWLCPLLALPVALLVCWAWAGREDLPLRKWAAPIYLGWGVVLLWGTAARFAGRVERSIAGGARPWAVLAVTLALTLYLTRRSEVLARAGRIFFPALAVLLVGVLLLDLPAMEWDGLLRASPADWEGLPLGTAWAASLLGYAVFGGLLPAEGQERTGLWCAGAGGVLAALLLVTVGVFGPGLTLRMDEPFLYLLSGVGVEGAFQRGEAILYALAALGELSLFALLAHGCARLWESFCDRGGWAPTAAGFALAAFAPELGSGILTGPLGLVGGSVLGAGVPLVVHFAQKVWKRKESGPTFGREKMPVGEDVGAKSAGKKSYDENEKKC